jgi:hypothetical protein
MNLFNSFYPFWFQFYVFKIRSEKYKMKNLKHSLTFCCIFFIFHCESLWAQKEYVREPSTTRYIKDIYQYVQEKIARNQYYINELKLNPSNLPWLASQNYQSTQQYFYSFVGDDSPSLRLVTIVSKINQINYYYEYLYDNDGKMVFCYEKQSDTKALPYRELKAYFHNNLCINLLLDQEIIEANKTAPYKARLDAILNEGKLYFQKFLADMKEMKEN